MGILLFHHNGIYELEIHGFYILDHIENTQYNATCDLLTCKIE